MLSRVADSIYWVARYVERADHLARFIDVTREFVLDVPTGRDQWLPLVSVTGDEDPYVLAYRDQYPAFPHQPTSDQFFDEKPFLDNKTGA